MKGPKGELAPHAPPGDAARAGRRDQFTVARPSEEKRHKALHGLTRTLVAEHGRGVSKGFSKTLEIQGVGYKAEAKPYGVNLIVGLLAPGEVQGAEGHQDLGREQHARSRSRAPTRRWSARWPRRSAPVRPPEPYKGKGIRYQGEQVRRKAGKTGAK